MTNKTRRVCEVCKFFDHETKECDCMDIGVKALFFEIKRKLRAEDFLYVFIECFGCGISWEKGRKK